MILHKYFQTTEVIIDLFLFDDMLSLCLFEEKIYGRGGRPGAGGGGGDG